MSKRKLTNYQGSWIEPSQSLMSLSLGFVHILRFMFRILKVQIKSAYEPSGTSGLGNMKRPRDFYSPLDGMLVHRRVTPSIKFVGTTHLYTWAERRTVRGKCLAQEHNTASPTRARTRTARSRDDCTNHKALASSNITILPSQFRLLSAAVSAM